MRVTTTDDPAEVLERAAEHLRSDPVAHNLVLTLLHQRVARPEAGRYAWTSDGDAVLGVLFHSPLSFVATLTPMPRRATEALVAELAAGAPELPGVNADARTAAAFAGAWATATRHPVEPAEGQRLYRCDELVEPPRQSGAPRRATSFDLDVIAAWTAAFNVETDTPPGLGSGDPRADAEVALATRDLWLWQDDDEPLGMVGVTRPVAGVGRIGPVYTPPPCRNRGVAAALTAHGTAGLLAGGHVAALYTQLANPVSNALYQRLGFRPVSELVRYRFRP